MYRNKYYSLRNNKKSIGNGSYMRLGTGKLDFMVEIMSKIQIEDVKA